MSSLKDGIRSLVRVDFQGHVHKHFRGTGAKERCENEIEVLRTLEQRDCSYVPKLLEAFPEEHYIVTTSCGSPVEDSIPKKKADSLFLELEKVYGIKHDDPEPRNITYDPKLGRFCIIDFELAQILPHDGKSSNGKTVSRMQWYGTSKQGRRHLTNQDSFYAYTQNKDGNIISAQYGEVIMPCNFASFSVSDGVGGNRGGEFASKLVVKNLCHFLSTKNTFPVKEKSFVKTLKETHKSLTKIGSKNEHAQDMCATFVGMIVQEDTITWANVGDSRLYRLRDGELEQISKDHNFIFRLWKRGELSEFQYRMHPRKNILFDAMGGRVSDISPCYGSFKWQKGDTFLICSDGIIDGLTENKLSLALSADGDARQISEQMLDLAVKNSGNDDTTLFVVKIT